MAGQHDPIRQAETAIPPIALTHGQTLLLPTDLGLHNGVSVSTSNHYIKSLRKLGIPFDKGKGQECGHRQVAYDFEELMELTVALLLRVYGTLPDSVVEGLRLFRDDLRPIYRKAYFDATARVFPPVRISEDGGSQSVIEGLFLDLNIRYSAGRLIEFGPLELLPLALARGASSSLLFSRASSRDQVTPSDRDLL